MAAAFFSVDVDDVVVRSGEITPVAAQERARRVPLRPGRITTVPDIRLDPAGTISGTVRDETSGAPVGQVCVFPYATDWGFNDFCTNKQGQYRITGLGPYAWPLEFTDTSKAYGTDAIADAAPGAERAG